MKVLVIGGGGREHALSWKLAQSEKVSKLFIAPGNPGTSHAGENVAIKADDIEALKAFALKEKVDLTVVGPEQPLAMGIVDIFKDAGLKVFGPTGKAAELEASKVFCKDLMAKYDIPTASYKEFSDAEEAKTYVSSASMPIVVKADGLAAGKGVLICQTSTEAIIAVDSIMELKNFGEAGNKIIVEEFLTGEEVSFLAITDGTTVIPLAPAQDHKAIYDGDKGPNTGGMGAYSPAPIVTPELQVEIMERVMLPVVEAMRAEERPYSGVLYAGLMIDNGEIKVLEFNCRFGDPEAQPIFMRLKSDLVDVLLSAAEGRLSDVPLQWHEKSAVCVVMSSGGYPGLYDKGFEIKGIEAAEADSDVVVFHAGTTIKDGKVVTSGGRVLGVTALGADTIEAIEKAYLAVGKISWDGVYFRTDIGEKASKR